MICLCFSKNLKYCAMYFFLFLQKDHIYFQALFITMHRSNKPDLFENIKILKKKLASHKPSVVEILSAQNDISSTRNFLLICCPLKLFQS